MLMHQQQTAFENIVGKGEIANNKQFLLFPQCFQLNQITVSPFVHIFDIISLFAIELEEHGSQQAISPLPTMFSTQSDSCIPVCPYF